MNYGEFDLTAVLIVMTIFFSLCILGVAIMIAAIKRRNMEMEVYKKAVEKGLPVPELKAPKTPLRTLKAALVWLALGIGLFLILITTGGHEGLAASSVPILIGVALLISYAIEKKADKNGDSKPPIL